MLKHIFLFLFNLVIIIVPSDKIFSLENNPKTPSKIEITNLVRKWAEDVNNKNLEGVCGDIAPEFVSIYPGTKDRNYEEICQFFKGLMTDPQTTMKYDEPKIEQINVSCDLAVVTAIWTSTFSEKNKPKKVVVEKAVEVLRRQKDGSWKFIISYAFPEPQ